MQTVMSATQLNDLTGSESDSADQGKAIAIYQPN